jgi:hypothetical protein
MFTFGEIITIIVPMEETLKKTLAVCLVCLSVAGCSIKNARVTEDNKEQLLEDATWSIFLTDEEAGQLVSAFKASAFTGENIEGKTLGQVLAEQKRREAEDEAVRQAKIYAWEKRFDEVRVRDKLDTYLTVTPAKKVFLSTALYDGVIDSRIQIDLVIDNKSDKEIKTLSGRALFKDRSGRILTERLLTYYGLAFGSVKAGETKQWTTMQRNAENDPDDKALKNTALNDLTFEWQTRRIVFADGSAVGME